jgi:monoamine oxidase
MASNITLSSPVTSIKLAYKTKNYTLVTSEKLLLRTKYVVITGPPAMVSSISIMPPMQHAKAQLLQRMPEGTSMKYFVFYDEPWWRTKGLSGAIMATKIPAAYSQKATSATLFDACQEHSPYLSTVKGRGKAALMCWVEGEVNQRLYARTKTAAERRTVVLEWLAFSLNDTRAISLDPSVVEYNWADQPYARGAYTGAPLSSLFAAFVPSNVLIKCAAAFVSLP